MACMKDENISIKQELKNRQFDNNKEHEKLKKKHEEEKDGLINVRFLCY